MQNNTSMCRTTLGYSVPPWRIRPMPIYMPVYPPIRINTGKLTKQYHHFLASWGQRSLLNQERQNGNSSFFAAESNTSWLSFRKQTHTHTRTKTHDKRETMFKRNVPYVQTSRMQMLLLVVLERMFHGSKRFSISCHIVQSILVSATSPHSLCLVATQQRTLSSDE